MSTTTPKVVMFNMEIGEAPEASEDTVDHNKLEEQVTFHFDEKNTPSCGNLRKLKLMFSYR